MTSSTRWSCLERFYVKNMPRKHCALALLIAAALLSTSLPASAQQAPRWDGTDPTPLVANLPDPINVSIPELTTISVEGHPAIGHMGVDGTVYLDDQYWTAQIAPSGIIYRSYYASLKEPRMAAVINRATGNNSFFDGTIGGRFGVFRYGTTDDRYPQGWQVDIEAAVFPRLDFKEDRDLMQSDFRVGVPLTYGQGPVQFKLAYYHISAHVGDEFLIKNPTFVRKNYVRDGLAFGVSYYLEGGHLPIETRLYAEADWSINTMGGAEPWEFQFGAEFVGTEQGPCFVGGSPFVAVGGHLREEVDFGGTFVLQGGLLWRTPRATNTFRIGLEYVNGKNVNYELLETFEQRFGLGIWYDF